MRIAILNSYGSNPDMFKKIIQVLGLNLNISSPSFRKDLAEELDKLEPNYEEKDVNQTVYDRLLSEKIKYLKFKGDEEYVRFKYENGWAFTVKIEEIKEGSVWKISEYDGAEYIEYWNSEPKLINPEIGEYEW